MLPPELMKRIADRIAQAVGDMPVDPDGKAMSYGGGQSVRDFLDESWVSKAGLIERASIIATQVALEAVTEFSAGKSGEDARSQPADARLRALDEALNDCADCLARFTHSRSSDDKHVQARAALNKAYRALALGAGER